MVCGWFTIAFISLAADGTTFLEDQEEWFNMQPNLGCNVYGFWFRA